MEEKNNKVLEFARQTMKKYHEMPTEELLLKAELDGDVSKFSEKAYKKLLKNIKATLYEFISQTMANQELYNSAADDMNNIEEEILGVIDGTDIGRTGGSNGSKMFVMVVTTKNAYVYSQTNTTDLGVWGAAGLLTGLGALIAKNVKKSSRSIKYDKEIYSLAEFVEKVKFGIDYAGIFTEFYNWSVMHIGNHRCKMILRTNLVETFNLALKVLNGEYKTENYETNTKISYIDELKALKELLDQGIITQKDFDEKKEKILNK